ncbi:hypothetical protein L7F22_044295 [Adiantum nelumboides]|nr:hypothetical protein [Adiantum nelumboides]
MHARGGIFSKKSVGFRGYEVVRLHAMMTMLTSIRNGRRLETVASRHARMGKYSRTRTVRESTCRFLCLSYACEYRLGDSIGEFNMVSGMQSSLLTLCLREQGCTPSWICWGEYADSGTSLSAVRWSCEVSLFYMLEKALMACVVRWQLTSHGGSITAEI